MFFLLLCILLIGVYAYIKQTRFTLRSDIPGLSPHFLVGNLLQAGILTRGVPLTEAIGNFKKYYGDIFQFWLGPAHFVVINDVDDVQHVLNNRHIYDQGDLFVEKVGVLFPDSILCTTGHQYKRHATATLPIFRRNKITTNLDLFIDCTDKVLMKWREQPEGKIHSNIFEQMQNIFFQSFGLVGFNYDFHMLDADENGSTNELSAALLEIANVFQTVIFTPIWFSKLYLKFNPTYQRAQATIERYIYQMIEQEIATAKEESPNSRKRKSLIASLVASLQADEASEAMKREEERRGLTRREVLQEMLLFLMAGSDSTSSVFTWFIHLMSKHPRVQQKIKAELIEKNITDRFTVDQLDSLVYLDCVIKEVLRYCPPATGTIRTLIVDDFLPKSQIPLYKGDSVFIAFHNLARDPRYWSINPNIFYPERFLETDRNHHPCALLPFGGGHRQCIGQDLARFQLKVVAARMMQQVTFGDGGPKVNCDEHFIRTTVLPKKIGVTFTFA